MTNRRRRPKGEGKDLPGESLQFSLLNLALGGAGLLALALGYWFLANGSITAAPLLLVLGYVVLIPLALIL
jgi:pheromone shutdown protein TraB